MIEEGFNGRTCVFDDPVEGGFKSGVQYLPPCLMSHNPLDGLKTLTGLPKLATLMLADTGLTDESLQTVAALQHLSHLLRLNVFE